MEKFEQEAFSAEVCAHLQQQLAYLEAELEKQLMQVQQQQSELTTQLAQQVAEAAQRQAVLQGNQASLYQELQVPTYDEQGDGITNRVFHGVPFGAVNVRKTQNLQGVEVTYDDDNGIVKDGEQYL